MGRFAKPFCVSSILTVTSIQKPSSRKIRGLLNFEEVAWAESKATFPKGRCEMCLTVTGSPHSVVECIQNTIKHRHLGAVSDSYGSSYIRRPASVPVLRGCCTLRCVHW